MRKTAILLMVLVLCRIGVGAESLSPETLLPGHQATDAYAPVAAFGNGCYLVIWQAAQNEGADIVGLRLDENGRPLDAKPFLISDAKDCQERPRVAFGGGHFLVVWQDLRNGKDYDVYAARVTPEGKVLDPEGIAVSAEKHNQAKAAVCFDGKDFNLLWCDLRDGKTYQVWGTRVGTDGRVKGPAAVVLASRYTTQAPGLGAIPSGGVIAAANQRGAKLWAMRDGKRIAEPVDLACGGSAKGRFWWEPVFASDGKKLLAVFDGYRQWSRGGSNWYADAVLLDPARAVAGGGKITEGINFTEGDRACMRNPAAAWDGEAYVVAWDIVVRDRNKYPYNAVFMRRLARDGKILGERQTVAGERGSGTHHPASASNGRGTTLIAYERHPKTGDVPIKIAFRMLRAK